MKISNGRGASEYRNERKATGDQGRQESAVMAPITMWVPRDYDQHATCVFRKPRQRTVPSAWYRDQRHQTGKNPTYQIYRLAIPLFHTSILHKNDPPTRIDVIPTSCFIDHPKFFFSPSIPKGERYATSIPWTVASNVRTDVLFLVRVFPEPGPQLSDKT